MTSPLDPNLPTPEPTSRTNSRMPKNLVRGVSISALTGILLTATARPLFWQDARYLDDAPPTQATADGRGQSLTLDGLSQTQRSAASRISPQSPDLRIAAEALPQPESGALQFPSEPDRDTAVPQMLRISRGLTADPQSPAPAPVPTLPPPLVPTSEPSTASTPATDDAAVGAAPLQSISQSLTALLLPPALLPEVVAPSGSDTDTALAATAPSEASDLPGVATSDPSSTAGETASSGSSSTSPPEAPPPQETARLREQIQVEQFVVRGSTVFSPEDLAAIALNAVNDTPSEAGAAGDTATDGETPADPCRDLAPVIVPGPLVLTPGQLVQASDAIEQCYIQNGYINSGAFIAEAELTGADDGIVEISVVEGSLEAIDVVVNRAGLFGLNPSYVEARLRSAIGNPFNLDALVEAVQLLELDPLITQISTEIVPGTQTGTSILNATVQQDDGFDLALFFDNDRSPSVGSFRLGASVSQANLLGLGDRLSLGYSFTEGSDEFNLGYSIPVNPRNGNLAFNFTTTESEVIEEPFTILDIQSVSRNYELSYRQPLVLTPTEELALSLRLSRRESQAEFLETIAGEPIPFPGTGADAEGRTRISALRFGQEWIKRNADQVIALLSEFSLGIDAFGSTIQPVPPDSRFFLWRGQGQWVKRLGPDSLFILRGNAQLSDRPLLPNEQFSFGGQRAGRGYRLNTLLRDNGWFLSAEGRFPLFRLPEDNILMQIAPFIEAGGGWNNGDLPETLSLTSTGVGLIFDVDDDISARLDWGIPLSDFETSGSALQDSGIHFSIKLTPF